MASGPGCVTWSGKNPQNAVWNAMSARPGDWTLKEICAAPVLIKEDGFDLLLETGELIELEEGSQG